MPHAMIVEAPINSPREKWDIKKILSIKAEQFYIINPKVEEE